ncbi:MAG TPA: peptidase E [Chloroflexota bacterium]|nr:peptidase E [Chloroflexota bacterium]
MCPRRQIIALGGGGFSMEPDNPLLDDYVVAATGKEQPRICFIPTASGDSDNYVLRFYQAFAGRGCRATHLPLFQRKVADLRSLILQQDAVYIGGGNTANMLAVWRLHGLDVVLREAWEAGVVLAGISAGALCWFEGGTTDSFGPTLVPLRDGLGLLAGSLCAHYDGEEQRRPLYRRCVAEGILPGGLAIDDGCAVHFEGTEIGAIVSSRPTARAYRVERSDTGDCVVETPLDARFLG